MSYLPSSGTTRRSFLTAAGSVGALALTGAPPRAQTAGNFVIGAIASLTGPAAAFSKDWAEGFNVYVKSWNERGGANGRRIAINMLDDETSPVNAVNAFRRHATDPAVNVVWIALASQTALGIKAISAEFQVPIISGGGVDELGKPAAPWFFKIAPGGSDYIRALIEFGKRQNYKTIGSLHATDAIGQADMKWIKEFAAGAGITVVAQETFALTDTNFTPQLVNIRNAKPDFFYNGATGNPAILAYKQLKQLEIKVPLVMSQAAISAAFFQAIGGREQAEGVYCVISVGALPAEIGGDTARLHDELSRALGRPAILFHSFGWDTGIVTEWALKNSDGTRAGLRGALDRAQSVPGINGPLSFTPDNHIGQDTRGLTIARLLGGKWTKV